MIFRRTLQFAAAVTAFAVTFSPGTAFGDENGPDDGAAYRMPPQVLADIIDAPQTPGVSLSPDASWLLVLNRPGYPPIDEVAQPELRLAGLRINPRSNGPSRDRPFDGLAFRRLAGGDEIPVSGLPAAPRITGVSWSPDGQHIAFVLNVDDALSLWTAALADGKARRVTPADMALNGVYGRPYEWLPDSRGFVVRAVPAGRGAAPAEPVVPAGPVIQQNLGRKAPARTYQDLLQNAHDEALFDHYATSQLARVSLKGKVTRLGEPGVYRGVDPSPDGEYLLVESVRRPYSYTLPESRFPRRIEVLDRDGRPVHRVADLPLQDQIPIAFGSVATGPRSVGWRADAGAELTWAEALDGGDGASESGPRDRVLTLAAPFDGAPLQLAELEQRFGGVTWGDDDLALVSSWWWKTRNMKVWRVRPADRDATPELLQDRSWQDRYSDPGQPLMRQNTAGRQVILTADGGRTLFLRGDGASPEGDRPFLDAFDIASGETTRLFRSEAPYYESPVELVDVEGRVVLTRRESQDDPPNYFLRDLGAGTLEQKTFFPNPNPQLAGVHKELIRYPRADGVQLTATLYLPAGYDKDRDGPLPLLLWAYPNEFKDKDAAGQVTDSPYRFTRVYWGSPMLFLTQGYAVLDDAAMPVLGEGEEEPNDTFVEQLVASAAAAIDAVAAMGVADPDRVAVGGHSYGAFMTANLLAHSDLFRAGVARSGAYNRTLTPFGFQAEERSLWEAPDIYFAMSPFMHADKIDEPLLLVHGAADNNSGTFPMQSERLYDALKGHGATARLVMLPHESHGYRARESLMHLLWETHEWLENYVRNAGPREAAPVAGSAPVASGD